MDLPGYSTGPFNYSFIIMITYHQISSKNEVFLVWLNGQPYEKKYTRFVQTYAKSLGLAKPPSLTATRKAGTTTGCSALPKKKWRTCHGICLTVTPHLNYTTGLEREVGNHKNIQTLSGKCKVYNVNKINIFPCRSTTNSFTWQLWPSNRWHLQGRNRNSYLHLNAKNYYYTQLPPIIYHPILCSLCTQKKLSVNFIPMCHFCHLICGYLHKRWIKIHSLDNSAHSSDYYYELVKFTMIGKSYHLLAEVTSIYMHYICLNLGEGYKDIIRKIFLINIPF